MRFTSNLPWGPHLRHVQLYTIFTGITQYKMQCTYKEFQLSQSELLLKHVISIITCMHDISARRYIL